MSITITQIILATVFLAVLLIVEGAYLFFRHNVQADDVIDDRMKKAAIRPAGRDQRASILREIESVDPLSQFLMNMYPDGARLFGATKAQPVLVIGGSAIAAIALWAFLTALLPAPPVLLLAVALVVSFGLPFLVLSILVSTIEKKFADQLPDAINLVTRGLQAGHPVPVALEMIGKDMDPPISIEFANAMEKINLGGDRNEALREISTRFKNPDFMFFLSATEIQRESGGNLVDVLDNLTSIIRERANMRRKAHAISAEGRLTAMIVGSLPYALLFFLLSSNPEFFDLGLTSPLFWPLMIGAWFLWLAGIIWIWRMINIKV